MITKGLKSSQMSTLLKHYFIERQDNSQAGNMPAKGLAY